MSWDIANYNQLMQIQKGGSTSAVVEKGNCSSPGSQNYHETTKQFREDPEFLAIAAMSMDWFKGKSTPETMVFTIK